MDELIIGAIAGIHDQAAPQKTDCGGGNNPPLVSRETPPVVLRHFMGLCDDREISVHLDLLPRRPLPRRVHLKVCGQVLGGFRFGNCDATLDRSLMFRLRLALLTLASIAANILNSGPVKLGRIFNADDFLERIIRSHEEHAALAATQIHKR